ncbi:MAG: TfoX/Sxy family protein [Gammaproteobacteria bacterium]|nr:TfoX/Sxy family protein [Gammaproteobacteria bacterium]
MAKPYLEKLSGLIHELNIQNEVGRSMQAKHFFSGAALYVNGEICASWSPGGLAFKLPEKEVESLIGSGRAIPLKYFPKGHIKKGYALFENPDESEPSRWKRYFVAAARQV